MIKEQQPSRKCPPAGPFFLKRVFGPFIATVIAALALSIFLLINVQDWNPEFAKGMLIGGGVAIIGGFFLMVKEVAQAVVDYAVSDYDL